MSKYAELDAAIVERIREGHKQFFMIASSKIYLLAKIAAPNSEGFRAIDRRLQALRKAGKIQFSHKEDWSLINKEKS